jgi:hypothetical protein
VVWGVYPWKDLVLASDMNSGLWIFRVTADVEGSDSGGSGSAPGGPAGQGPGQPAAPERAPGSDPAGARSGDPGGPGLPTWVAVAGLALGLLAAGAVARSARRRRSS